MSRNSIAADQPYMEPNDIISRFRHGSLGYDDASNLMREAFLAAGATPKQASSAMGYAYERGHSSGMDEVLNVASSLISIFKGE